MFIKSAGTSIPAFITISNLVFILFLQTMLSSPVYGHNLSSGHNLNYGNNLKGPENSFAEQQRILDYMAQLSSLSIKDNKQDIQNFLNKWNGHTKTIEIFLESKRKVCAGEMAASILNSNPATLPDGNSNTGRLVSGIFNPKVDKNGKEAKDINGSGDSNRRKLSSANDEKACWNDLRNLQERFIEVSFSAQRKYLEILNQRRINELDKLKEDLLYYVRHGGEKKGILKLFDNNLRGK